MKANKTLFRLCGTLLLSLLALAGALLLLNLHPQPAHADPSNLFVKPKSVGTCTMSSPCLLGTALSMATDGDRIYLSQGTYVGGGGAVVTLTKSITLYGGWNGLAGRTIVRDPVLYPSTLDGAGQRRVVYVTESITVALDGLHIANGSAFKGAGIYADNSRLTVQNCHLYSNTASVQGGAVFLSYGHNSVFADNEIYDNTGLSGGGLYSRFGDDISLVENAIHSNDVGEEGGGIRINGGSEIKFIGNEIYGNTAGTNGGGLSLGGSTLPTLVDNRVYENTAHGFGGGIDMSGGDGATLSGNQVYSNTNTGWGGGIYVHSSDDATLTGNRFYGNTADKGAGLCVQSASNVTLENNVIANNQLTTGDGAGLAVNGADVHLLHTTIARNHGGNGQGIYAETSPNAVTVWLTNTILVSHTVGIEVDGAGSAASLAGTLWGSGAWANGTDTVETSGGTIATSADVQGEPAFMDYAGGDYHIGPGSAAADQGVSASTSSDIDGESRPFCAAPDLGADEYGCCVDLDGTRYPFLQDAVDASTDPADVIKVAGTCSGVFEHDWHKQAVYITKTLTIRGGYSPDFSAWSPGAYPTTLDAVEGGMVVFIVGEEFAPITPTLEALRMTRGATSHGGGVNAVYAHLILSNCHVYSNTASVDGGGIRLGSGSGTLLGNWVHDNAAGDDGGGVSLSSSADVVMINNVVVDNQLVDGGDGAGIHLYGASAHLLHTTLARNHGGHGQGICTENESSVWLTNTILVSHTIGIELTTIGDEAALEATLWGSGAWGNLTDTTHINRSTLVTGTVNIWDDPVFVDPDGGDYHVDAGSAAIDAAVDAGVAVDVDGEPRLWAPDIGADEYLRRVYLPLILRSYP
jgi:parallel beta-helix repeat protein